MGNTTSDRVAGERHGARAARAEGAGGHGLGKEHKIMVGSTEDPGVFSLPDSKVSVPTPRGWRFCRGLGVRTPPPSLITPTSVTVFSVKAISRERRCRMAIPLAVLPPPRVESSCFPTRLLAIFFGRGQGDLRHLARIFGSPNRQGVLS